MEDGRWKMEGEKVQTPVSKRLYVSKRPATPYIGIGIGRRKVRYVYIQVSK